VQSAGIFSRALQNEPLAGLLLPCNVTVEEGADGVLVSIINPSALLEVQQLAENDVVRSVASEARAHLERVAAALAA